jgi:hypothetical protein
MMDDSTVQTTPEPRLPHESDSDALAEAEHQLGVMYQVAFAGWSAAVLLAAHLIETVIA